MADKKEIIYCSGPLFCPEEIGGMTAIARVLELAGYETFLPHRDGLEYYLMKYVNVPVKVSNLPANAASRWIFALDVYQIAERCDAVVMNMNGRVPDEGAVAEAGIAYASGVPVVIYKNDVRSEFNGMDNAMVACLSHAPVVTDIRTIPRVLKRVMETAGNRGELSGKGKNLPPLMGKTVDLGRKIWKIMAAVHLNGGKTGKDAELIDLIAGICTDHPAFFDWDDR